MWMVREGLLRKNFKNVSFIVSDILYIRQIINNAYFLLPRDATQSAPRGFAMASPSDRLYCDVKVLRSIWLKNIYTVSLKYRFSLSAAANIINLVQRGHPQTSGWTWAEYGKVAVQSTKPVYLWNGTRERKLTLVPATVFLRRLPATRG